MTNVQIREAIPPNHTPSDVNVISHVGVKVPYHPGKELGGDKLTNPSPPLPTGHSEVEESPTSVKKLGSRADVMCEVSLTISSKYLLTSRKNSGSFPPAR
ncbi:hypothetical protein XENOCAPTIV_017752 [Xenoophorus captivus]|uniref:Uncharacterized protein n=1 Tax=Xenoophorus captivus TaxID=1517983 RepID=A0ABV0QM33_9TELE